MNTTEFSNQFDLLLNQRVHFGERFGKTGSLDIDEYEKSILLTNAQEKLFLELYKGYDTTEFNKRALAPLVDVHKVEFADMDINEESVVLEDYNSYRHIVPVNLSYILNEQVKTISNKTLNVEPISIDYYNTLRNNPFRKPNKNKCWRTELNPNAVNTSINNKGSRVEIITSYELVELDYYLYTYLKRPEPIVLVDLITQELSINGYSEVNEASLNNNVHEDILRLAVNEAINIINNNQSNQ